MKPKYLEIDINSIELDLDNPRIKRYLEIFPGDPSAEGIALAAEIIDSGKAYETLEKIIEVSNR